MICDRYGTTKIHSINKTKTHTHHSKKKVQSTEHSFFTWIDLSMKSSPPTVFFLVFFSPVFLDVIFYAINSKSVIALRCAAFCQHLCSSKYASFTFKFIKCRWFFCLVYSFPAPWTNLKKRERKRVYFAKGTFQNKWRLNSRVYCVCHMYSLLVTVVLLFRFLVAAVLFLCRCLHFLMCYCYAIYNTHIYTVDHHQQKKFRT